MRIFYIDPQSYNNLSIYDYSLLKGIDVDNIVYFNSINYDYKEDRRIEMRQVFKYNNITNPIRKILSYSLSVTKIAKHVISERPALVHIQWFRVWIIDYLFVMLCHLLGTKVVYTAHNILPHNRHIWDTLIFRLYYNAVDAIIVHSKRTKKEMSDILNIKHDKVHVIHHGILDSDIEDAIVNERMSELRNRFSIKENDIVFSCLGIQNKYKGTDMVLRVWKDSAILNSSQCHLLIVGRNDNIDFSDVENIGNVHINIEKVSDIDFEAYLRISSVVLLPYRAISQSGVLFSALSSGIPVLVSNVGGLSEPLEYGKVGWNIGEPSAKNLKTKMEELAYNPTVIIKTRDNTEDFKAVQKIYDWTDISKKTFELYSSL